MTALLLGYARVSTAAQCLDLQRDALLEAGCARVFADVASGARDDRPQLAEVLQQLRPGDCLVVYRVDRLARSLRHLLDVALDLEARGVTLRSLSDGVDTSTPTGKLLLSLMGSLAEWERLLIRERAAAGLAAARARGRKGGRKAVMTPTKVAAARVMLAMGEHTAAQVAESLGVGRATLYRALSPVEAADSLTQAQPARSLLAAAAPAPGEPSG